MDDMYDRLTALLEERGMSKHQLSMLVEMPYSSIVSAFARKSKSFTFEQISSIARSLGVSPEWIMTGQEKETLDSLPENAPSQGASRAAPDATVFRRNLLAAFEKLNPEGKREAAKRIGEMAKLDEYKKNQ